MRKLSSRSGASILVACACALTLGACSGSNKASSPNTTSTVAGSGDTATQQGSARITSFVVPASVQCGETSKTTVRVAYAVTHAARQELSIDGLAVAGVDGPRGSVNAPVHCDAVPHTVALIAFDANGARTSQVKMLNTLLPTG